jgi:hypothetical protein
VAEREGFPHSFMLSDAFVIIVDENDDAQWPQKGS